TDVLMSLQTGLIKTIYASPLGALALQWFTKVKYMSQVRMGYGTGGALMTKRKFDSLSDSYKALLRDSSRKYLERLVRQIKRDNESSVDVMKQSGVTLARMPGQAEIDKFHEAGRTIRKNLTGKLFPRELLDAVMAYLKEARQRARE
ncbi:MAG: TRAP transporter substrate-binding protein DctP, partial [Nitrospinales bacterium]